MSIAEYKKKHNAMSIVELEHFKVQIRKLKDRDYIGMDGVPSLYSIAEEEKGSGTEPESEDPVKMYNMVKGFVCACVSPDESRGMPAIVDKPESECQDWEISFGDTLTSEDAHIIFMAINEFTVQGGESKEKMDSFREGPSPSEGNSLDGKGVQQAST
jgi:hypothetical protein